MEPFLYSNKFAENNVNAIYKSFYATDIKQSFLAAKTIGFGGLQSQCLSNLKL